MQRIPQNAPTLRLGGDPIDWFERITGLREASYEQTQSRLSVFDGRLRSDGAERTYAVGRLELPSLAEAAPTGGVRLMQALAQACST